jgi:hypothetical protein
VDVSGALFITSLPLRRNGALARPRSGSSLLTFFCCGGCLRTDAHLARERCEMILLTELETPEGLEAVRARLRAAPWYRAERLEAALTLGGLVARLGIQPIPLDGEGPA